MEQKQQTLYRKVYETLHNVWDPIGISSDKNAVDEYHMYVPLIFDMLVHNADNKDIADELVRIEKDRMGLSGNTERATKVVKQLLQSKKSLYDI